MAIYCECGCGIELRQARYPSQQPRYVRNHHRPRKGATLSEETKRKISRTKLENPSLKIAAVHLVVRKERKGMCENCGKIGKTDMAFKRHPDPYTRDPEDYVELCRSCHKRLHHADDMARASLASRTAEVQAKRVASRHASRAQRGYW